MFADRRNAWKDRKCECVGRNEDVGVRRSSFWKRGESSECKKQSRFELWKELIELLKKEFVWIVLAYINC